MSTLLYTFLAGVVVVGTVGYYQLLLAFDRALGGAPLALMLPLGALPALITGPSFDVLGERLVARSTRQGRSANWAHVQRCAALYLALGLAVTAFILQFESDVVSEWFFAPIVVAIALTAAIAGDAAATERCSNTPGLGA